ncbi:hypothetical protein WME89_20655 [Sorangium sp. So ce321]|uniref:hypothetical protein n=1 Tax=Sorangium sp. So ce321 TaxID=3133300 RepID=UPI003F5EED84
MESARGHPDRPRRALDALDVLDIPGAGRDAQIPVLLEDHTPAETITSRRRVTIGAIARQESLA